MVLRSQAHRLFHLLDETCRRGRRAALISFRSRNSSLVAPNSPSATSTFSVFRFWRHFASSSQRQASFKSSPFATAQNQLVSQIRLEISQRTAQLGGQIVALEIRDDAFHRAVWRDSPQQGNGQQVVIQPQVLGAERVARRRQKPVGAGNEVSPLRYCHLDIAFGTLTSIHFSEVCTSSDNCRTLRQIRVARPISR
jgi:hypothetical protein